MERRATSKIDRAINQSKKAINILWSLFFLCVAVYVMYQIPKYIKSRSNKKHKGMYADKKLKSIRNNININKHIDEEETSMVSNPKYALNNPQEFVCISHDDDITPNNTSNSNKFYTYNDLLEVINSNNDIFFNEYLSAIKRGLKYKQQRYGTILKSKMQELTDNNNKTQGNLRGQSAETHQILAELLNIIEDQLHNLTIDKVKHNFKRIVWHKDHGLETLVERDDIKNLIARQIFAFKQHQKHLLSSHQNGLILGDSGIGKTKIGECLAHALSLSGIMLKNKAVIVGKEKVVSPYVDGTAPLSQEFFEMNLECIVIFEEIYSVTPPIDPFGGVSRNHGGEFLTVLLKFTEDYKGLCRIFGIGYEKDIMERFIGPNQGMERRFPIVLRLSPYTDKGLTQLLIRFLNTNADINMSEDEADALFGMIIQVRKNNANLFTKFAGSMENLANTISDTIYYSKQKKWIPGNTENNIKLLMNGINTFVRTQNKNGKILDNVVDISSML